MVYAVSEFALGKRDIAHMQGFDVSWQFPYVTPSYVVFIGRAVDQRRDVHHDGIVRRHRKRRGARPGLVVVLVRYSPPRAFGTTFSARHIIGVHADDGGRDNERDS